MLNKFQICNNLDQCLNGLVDNTKLAVAISREHISHISSNMSSKMYCFESDENFYGYSLTFFVRKNSNYLNSLNDFILKANSGGLINRWQSKYKVRVENDPEETAYEKITQSHLRGVLWIGSLLYTLSILSLGLERIINRRVRNPNRSRFWTIAEMLIHPDRQFLLGTYSTFN